ncbi:MAG: SRPBCC family protein [bacterium]|nr:SRPBCC family protein [bacterium]
MAIYQLKTTQNLPISMQEAWDFMSSPYNLGKITPSEMGFEITNGILPTDKMYAGQIISYNVRPIAGIAMEWVTEITHVENLKYFVDEQRFGPYALWHHQHHLKEIEGGVQMDDLLHYKMPFGPLGQIMNTLVVKQKLKQIFDYRFEKLVALFGPFEKR